MVTADVNRDLATAQRTELILRKIDTLPTLPVVAVRLLALTSDEDANATDITRLIESDPALTAAVLRLCRTADVSANRQNPLPSIQRAVVLLGFNAIRHAVLSVSVLTAIPQPKGPEKGLDRPGFWMHSLAVAIVAEALARAEGRSSLARAEGKAALGRTSGKAALGHAISPDLAFVAGLLHDLGKLALDHVLPQAYARVVDLARTHRGDLAAYETRVLGVDHHRAGRRLAERWALPTELANVMAFHHVPPAPTPSPSGASNRGFTADPGRLAQLIGLADALVRERHVGYSGNHTTPHASARGLALGFQQDQLDTIVANLFPELESRGRALGLHDKPSETLLQQSLDRAQNALGHAHAALDHRSRRVTHQQRVLQALEAFNRTARPAGSVDDAVAAVANSSASLLGPGPRAILYQPPSTAPTAPWMLYNFDIHHADDITPLTPPATACQSLPDAETDTDLTAIPWLAARFEKPMSLRLQALSSGGNVRAWLIHSSTQAANNEGLQPLAGVWGNAIAAAEAHESARQLSESLVTANGALVRAQSQILRRETLARLGEMAAGAAHEMNNPLAVISGRSQMLTASLSPDHDDHRAARHIHRAAQQLSELISGLRIFAEPPIARRSPIDITTLVRDAITRSRDALPQHTPAPAFNFIVGPGVGVAHIDPKLIAQALDELLANAIQAKPQSGVWVRLDHLSLENHADILTQAAGSMGLQISIRDNGSGMTPHTLAHALDPFFSAHPAGRRVGMGLPRVLRWVEAHGGALRIESDPNRGTTTTLTLPVDSPPA